MHRWVGRSPLATFSTAIKPVQGWDTARIACFAAIPMTPFSIALAKDLWRWVQISFRVVAVLELLEELRQSTGDPIPLAWSPEDRPALAAIEVYPAATRLAHGSAARGGSIEGLEHRLDCSALNGELPTSTDAIDALVCLVAAADFLEGHACPPDDLNLAKTEGWIWTAESTEPGAGGEHC